MGHARDMMQFLARQPQMGQYNPLWGQRERHTQNASPTQGNLLDTLQRIIPVYHVSPSVREMALHFVSTSVLSSADGIAFENEEKKDTEEIRQAKAAAKAAENKPLFQQLEDLKAKKQEEYDANTKLLFGELSYLVQCFAPFSCCDCCY